MKLLIDRDVVFYILQIYLNIKAKTKYYQEIFF
jgi:hypothetical protein